MKAILSYLIFGFVALVSISSCKKFVEIGPPRTELIKSTVFENDATANAAMMDVYYNLRAYGFASGLTNSISFWGSFSSDEQVNYFAPYQPFHDNDLTPGNAEVLALWSDLYKTIYKTNAIIEGIAQSTGLSAGLKTQLEGEAKWVRAFCHFYLVNLFGDVPVITSTDYKLNASLPRSPQPEVYARIIADLKDAQNLLPDNYSFAGNERVRVNTGAATALLARVYLYTEDWANAEAQSSVLINNTSQYGLETDLTKVFRTTSKEAIFQLWSDAYPGERVTFFIFSSGPSYGALRPAFVTSFETGDQRWAAWGRNRVVSGITYYYLLKYADASIPPLDYTTVLRLAEQYLIRAETRAKQNKITGLNSAESDINIIRNRAGLGNTTANTQAAVLAAIENERRWELATEWGHRWFDLKRTNRADAVLGPIKGSTWQSTDVLYPIPQYQILNSNLTQNPGYQ